jgi:hypothetical protein
MTDKPPAFMLQRTGPAADGGSVGGPTRWGFVMSNGTARHVCGELLLHHGPGSFQPGPCLSLALSDRPGAAPVARRWHPAARGSAWLMRGKPLTSPSGSAVRDPNCRVPSANHAARLWRLRLERRLILPEHTSPSDMLSDWRAAERDTVASHTASKVAQLALAAATAAEAAALEVDAAATAAVEALERARSAATQARKAATQAAEALNWRSRLPRVLWLGLMRLRNERR